MATFFENLPTVWHANEIFLPHLCWKFYNLLLCEALETGLEVTRPFRRTVRRKPKNVEKIQKSKVCNWWIQGQFRKYRVYYIQLTNLIFHSIVF